jgi:hypothetical protein
LNNGNSNAWVIGLDPCVRFRSADRFAEFQGHDDGFNFESHRERKGFWMASGLKPPGQPVQPDQPEREEIRLLNQRLTKIADQLEQARIADYVSLLNRPWKLILSNFYSGIARGVGIAIGFTVFAALIVYFLRMLGALNLPIIGDFIADIVKIVQVQLEGRYY